MENKTANLVSSAIIGGVTGKVVDKVPNKTKQVVIEVVGYGVDQKAQYEIDKVYEKK